MALNKEIDFSERISSEVKNAFLQVYNTLKSRETQLLRQIEVLAQHYKLNDSYDKCVRQVTVVFENENDILNSVANFGRLDFNGLSCDSDFFKIEDYQKPESDHVSLYKYLENSYAEHLNTSNSNKLKQLPQETDEPTNEYICAAEEISSVPHTNDKEEVEAIEASNSILECIEKQDASLCLHVSATVDKEPSCTRTEDTFVDDDETNSCVANHCEATTNVNSHSCLTSSVSVPNLHCKCSADSVHVSVSVIQTQNGSFLTSSENNLSEQQQQQHVNHADSVVAVLSHVPERVRTLSMKQPVQVQHWMKQIISEPEIEPAPTNVMEHSHIKVLLRKDSV